MTPDLRAALLECRFKRGCLEGGPDSKEPDLRWLRLCTHAGRPYASYRLEWPDYLAAYCFWQDLNAKWAGKALRRAA
jgi:hypothetical protein